MIVSIERLYYEQVLGIRKEYDKLNPLAAWMLIFAASCYVRKHNSIIEGSFPETGAAILTGNHFDRGDSLKAIYAGKVTAGRLISRVVVKKSLVEEGAYEPKEYLDSIGKEGGDLDKYSQIQAYALRESGVIPILRDNTDPNLASICNGVLRTGQMLGMFMMPSRDKECLLRNLQPGAAIFAMRHPHIPVYSIAFSGPPYGPDKISIPEKPVTYAQIKAEFGRRLSIAEFTIFLADITAERLPERSQRAWEIQRPIEFARLSS